MRIVTIFMLCLFSTLAQAQLILHYDFNGTVEDISGNGNDGTLVGNPAFIEASEGGALLFNNPLGQQDSTQYVLASDIGVLTDLTVGIRFRTSDSSRRNGRLYGNNDIGVVYNRGLSPNLSAVVGGSALTTDNPFVVDNQYRWLFTSLDSSTSQGQFFIDDNLFSTQTVSGDVNFNDLRIGSFGGNFASTATFFGSRLTAISDFVVFDTALNQTQISNFVNSIDEPKGLLWLILALVTLLVGKHRIGRT